MTTETTKTVTIPTPAEWLRDELISRLDEHYYLTYVGRGDQLTPDQSAALLRNDWESLYEDMDNWMSDARWDSVCYEIGELIKGLDGEFEDLDLILDTFDTFSEEWHEVRYEIEDRDRSDPIRDLAWGSVFVRIKIGDEVALSGNIYDDTVDVLDAIDLPNPDALHAAVREALPECWDSVTPFIFASVRLEDVYALGVLDDDAEIKVKGGSLLLENLWQGAGQSVELPNDFEVTIRRDRLMSDSDQVGYSWDDVCGFVPGSYPATVTKVSE